VTNPDSVDVPSFVIGIVLKVGSFGREFGMTGAFTADHGRLAASSNAFMKSE
jgi:hypothetical protein